MRWAYRPLTFLWKVMQRLARFVYVAECRASGMTVGKNLSVMTGVDFGSEPWLIRLGDHVRVSRGVQFVTHDGGAHVVRRMSRYSSCRIDTLAPISVGDNVFVGAGATILPGVVIGEHAIVAAGAVVTRSVPAFEIWGGVPARKIGSVLDYAERLTRA